MTMHRHTKFAIPALAVALALSACNEAKTPPAATDTTGNAMTDEGGIDTAPVTQPDGAVDPDGAGPDEAYGRSGEENAPNTNIDNTGEAVDISGDGKSTKRPGN